MSMLNKLTGIALGLSLAVCAFSAEAQETSRLQRILDSGKIRVGTTGDFAPMTVRDVASGGYKGFEIDMANALAEDLGVQVEFVPTDWKTMIAGVLADKYDIAMSGTSMNVGRAKVVGYTVPYIFNGTVPMTLKENMDRFKTWDDANQEGVKVAVILGTVFEEEAKAAFPNATIVSVEPPATGYQEVIAGRADVTITSTFDAAAVSEKFEAIGIFGEGVVRNERPLAYLTGQNDQVFINFMNTWLTLKKTSGFIDDLRAKWGL
jgi:cyclohexadienyl dehydratase